MKKSNIIIASIAVAAAVVAMPAQAGFFDELKKLDQKLQNAAEQIQKDVKVSTIQRPQVAQTEYYQSSEVLKNPSAYPGNVVEFAEVIEYLDAHGRQMGGMITKSPNGSLTSDNKSLSEIKSMYYKEKAYQDQEAARVKAYEEKAANMFTCTGPDAAMFAGTIPAALWNDMSYYPVGKRIRATTGKSYKKLEDGFEYNYKTVCKLNK